MKLKVIQLKNKMKSDTLKQDLKKFFKNLKIDRIYNLTNNLKISNYLQLIIWIELVKKLYY